MTISQLDGSRKLGGLVMDKEGEDNTVLLPGSSIPIVLENVMLVWTSGFVVVRMLLALVWRYQLAALRPILLQFKENPNLIHYT